MHLSQLRLINTKVDPLIRKDTVEANNSDSISSGQETDTIDDFSHLAATAALSDNESKVSGQKPASIEKKLIPSKRISGQVKALKKLAIINLVVGVLCLVAILPLVADTILLIFRQNNDPNLTNWVITSIVAMLECVMLCVFGIYFLLAKSRQTLSRVLVLFILLGVVLLIVYLFSYVSSQDIPSTSISDAMGSVLDPFFMFLAALFLFWVYHIKRKVDAL